MSRLPTLLLGKPLMWNLRTPADEENAGIGSEKESDATSTTEEDAGTKKRPTRLERPARG